MSRRIQLHFAAALTVAAVAVALAVMVVAAKPAQAYPSYESTCSSCHSATPSGTVTATPSKTTLTPGESYSVAVAVNLSASGQSGWWISNNDAATPAVSLSGGPGSSPFTANMTAPSAAGTYTYKVWGAKGTPGSGQALMTTYQITVAAAQPVGDTVAPVTSASGAANNAWYKSAVNVTLSATDTSGVDHIAYTLDGTPGTISGASGQVAISGDGRHTLTYQAVDKAAPANKESLKSLTITIDGVSPIAKVLTNVRVKKGARATIKYRVADTPVAGKATMTIKIKNRAGKVVKTLKAKGTVGSSHTVKFKCKLRKGVYKVTAQAKDQAGNVSKVSAAKRLKVR